MSTIRKEDGREPKEPTRKQTAAKAASVKTAAKKAAAKKAAAKKAAPVKAVAKKKSAEVAPAAKTALAARSKSAAKKTSAAKVQPAAKPRKAAKKPAAAPEESPVIELAFVDDAVGDVSDGEAHRLIASEPEGESSAALMEAYRADTTGDAEHGIPELEPEPAHEERARKRAVARTGKPQTGRKSEGVREAKPGQAEGEEGAAKAEPKLERLQKVLSQAGVASRRHAEEMIVAGRVMVNGQVVTQLGAKADPKRDHIRVDGKLLEGAERHRTFLLNKPKGYVTTVSDPEGRPTVMEFFSNFRERLYPVGRLDFQSEGLLLMSNDGELANLLTRAASGVEKTYLVKVSGQPSEGELEQLRSGVMIEREQTGSSRVRTSPASVRLIRPGENPWFEVVLTEGRNRELRKMFNAVGHFVEKIRRVGYGPLVLDVEPGQSRELSAEEVNALRLTAEGKLKPRRQKLNAMLPKEAGRSAERDRERGERPGRERQERSDRPRGERPFRRDDRAGGERGRPAERRPSGDRRGVEPQRFDGRPERREFGRGERGGTDRPYSRPFQRPSTERPPADHRDRRESGRGERGGFDRPFNRQFNRPSSERPPADHRDRRDERGEGGRGRDREGFNRPRAERGAAGFAPREGRSGGGRREGGERPRPYGGGREQRGESGGRPRGEFGGKPRFDRPQGSRPNSGRPQGNNPRFDRPRSERPERGNRGEEFREDKPQREFRSRLEIRPHEEGGERGQQTFRGERPAGGQRPGPEGGQRGDRGKGDGQGGESKQFGGQRSGGQRFGGQRRNHDGRQGHGGGFRKDHRGGGPRRGRS
jgi:23S rRNA pseudouridine2605 synthase